MLIFKENKQRSRRWHAQRLPKERVKRPDGRRSRGISPATTGKWNEISNARHLKSTDQSGTMINVTWSFSILVNSRFTHNATIPQKKLFNLNIYISYFYSPVKKMCLFVTGKWYWLRPYDVQRLPALGGAHPPVGDRRAHITHSTNAWWRHAYNTVGAQEYLQSSLPSHFSLFP